MKMLHPCTLVLSVLFILCTNPGFAQTAPKEIDIADLNVRDPFILTDKKTRTYILYKASFIKDSSGNRVSTVTAYKSKNLKLWKGPYIVYKTPEDNWARGPAWAPEVHQYHGKYYLFVTLTADAAWKKKQSGWPKFVFRGTQIFYADNPLGPFLPFKAHLPQTPLDRMALDGTLWVEDGIPYMVYCHEWVQIGDGAIALLQLKPDLSAGAGAPVTLFHASAAPWSSGHRHPNGRISHVTDGCFLYKTKTGKLLMIWSSFDQGNYEVGIAESVTNKVTGPWKQQKKLLFQHNGGHGMLFRSFDGKLLLVLHAPNAPRGKERARIFEVKDTGNSLVLGERLF